jgi:hypothetical protein
MTEDTKKRIEEIEKRIQELEKHMKMWRQAGGRGAMMALKAQEELKQLELEKNDLENGTNNLDIYLAEKKLKSLQYQKEDAYLIKKWIISNKIKRQEKELNTLKSR